MTFSRNAVPVIWDFDPGFGAGTRFRCEDIDYVARMSAAGFTGAYIADIVVYHHHQRREDAGLTQLKRDNDYARGAYYAKRPLSRDARVLQHWARNAFR
jgi:GT2 family glycosyltransferase